LCADPTQVFLKRRLSSSAVGLDVRSRSHKLEMPYRSIGVTHLMATAGLERPVVFILGGDDLPACEANPQLTEEELADLRQDHTRQIYVGITRTMERVVIYADRIELSLSLDNGRPHTDQRG
jgi:superfamily I DNA/RNA helicase